MLGEQFMVGEEICGVVVSIRFQVQYVHLPATEQDLNGVLSVEDVFCSKAVNKYIYITISVVTKVMFMHTKP